MNEVIRVIVAEDLDVLREHFINMVNSQKDMKVVANASSGKQVIQLVDQIETDIVLMDIEMDMKHDGILAAARILEKHPRIRIVFLTIHEDDETVFEAFETGAVDYVLKSASRSDVIESVRDAYENRSSIRPEIASKIRDEFSRIRKNENSFMYTLNMISQLTPTEMDIISLLMQGKRIFEISKIRSVEVVTIKSQINLLLKKLHKKRTKEVITMIKDLGIKHYFIKS